ncbi:MAG TPA: cytochrome c3 family protein [Burkholderiales bacterium]|nr:cytochrome c3 family protein [Burkholderiales bacterium]
MKLLVITQTRSRAGKPLQAKREIQGDWLRVGRAASCEIHLPDPRVALHQGLIALRDGIVVYSEGDAAVVSHTATTRKALRSARLKPGATVNVGPYRFTGEKAPEGFDGAIAIELVKPLAEAASGLTTRAGRLTLASLKLSKRWTSWALLVLVLALFFALPAGRILDLPWRAASQSPGVTGDRFWNPGPVVLAHQPVETRCAACHTSAFRHVQDRACLECHAAVGHHVGPELKPAALFQGARCASCHRDHKGVRATHRDDDGFCIACHRDLGAKARGTQAENASDFASDHPAFRLSLLEGDSVKKVRQGADELAESSNLVFPHAPHLDPAGVKSPSRGRVALDCGACHKPDASRRGFEPVSMERHCRECHRLEFEPAVTSREVPHGKPAEAVTLVSEFYASLALNGVKDSFEKAFGVPGEGLLRRVGQPSESERRVALELAKKKAGRVAVDLFEVRVCNTCHEVGHEDGAWTIAPVRIASRWMPQARFTHRSHAQSKCADCHDVARSMDSSDVAIPEIETCRKCHGGSKPVEKKVTSSCMLCHGFHDPSHPWSPGTKPGAVAEARGAR